jgi:hypothetical protein
MFAPAAGAMQHEEAAGVTRFGRVLGDLPGR